MVEARNENSLPTYDGREASLEKKKEMHKEKPRLEGTEAFISGWLLNEPAAAAGGAAGWMTLVSARPETAPVAGQG